MQLSFFQIPLSDGGEAGEALNRFLRGHRVLSCERHLIQAPSLTPYWVVCVEWLESDANGSSTGKRGKTVDYKEVLNEADFKLYAALRELRKTLAEKESVPVYAIFTNEQLAAIARGRPTSKTELGKVNGVGEARIEKYGEAVLKGIADEAGKTLTSSDS